MKLTQTVSLHQQADLGERQHSSASSKRTQQQEQEPSTSASDRHKLTLRLVLHAAMAASVCLALTALISMIYLKERELPADSTSASLRSATRT